jgi:hypothetical protein
MVAFECMYVGEDGDWTRARARARAPKPSTHTSTRTHSNMRIDSSRKGHACTCSHKPSSHSLFVGPPSLPPTHPPPCMQTFRTSSVEGQSVPVAAAGHEHDASIAAATGRGSMGWGFKGMYVYTYVCVSV